MLNKEDLIALWLHRWFAFSNRWKRLIDVDGWRDHTVAEAMKLEDGLQGQSPNELREKTRRMHRHMESRFRNEDLQPYLEDNFRQLAEVVSLPMESVPVLRLMIFLQAEPVITEALNLLRSRMTQQIASLIARATDRDEMKVLHWIGHKGTFERSGLFYSHAKVRGMPPQFFWDEACLNLIEEPTPPGKIFRDIATQRSGTELTFRDYEHLGDSLGDLRRYLRKALQQRKTGVNIALYGPPGTGKTELSRVLARDLKAQLFEVATSDPDGDPVPVEERFHRIRFAARMLSGRNFLLVDEAEDIFPEGSAFLPNTGPTVGHKAWLHEVLASNPIPVLWIANTTEGIDSAAARRFDMALSLPVPPERQRRKILRKICRNRVSQSFVAEIAKYPKVAPAVIAKCSQVAAEAARVDEAKRAYEDRIVRLVNQTLAIQGHGEIPWGEETEEPKSALPPLYDPAFVHCPFDLEKLAGRIRRRRVARLCLYGPPGTGKTSYIQWIAETAGLPVHLHKASDLLDKYLGKTEQRIAAAFKEAQAEDAILLFDEVDSFLRNRQTAVRSWEVTQVNELLKQMEEFDGIFAAATNLWEDLDEAALRRFDAKLFFGYLLPDQAVKLLGKYCLFHGLESPAEDELAKVAKCGALTPGDYATVLRNAALFPLKGPSDFVERLLAETKHKKDAATKAPLGFHAA